MLDGAGNTLAIDDIVVIRARIIALDSIQNVCDVEFVYPDPDSGHPSRLFDIKTAHVEIVDQ